MTGQEIMGAVLFVLAIIGAISGAWWRIEGRVKQVDDKAAKLADDLSNHKLHVAETYITKAGMREVRDQIMDAISGVRGSIEHLGGRIDSLYNKRNDEK